MLHIIASMNRLHQLSSLLRRHRYFLVFILLFAYVQSVYSRLTVWNQLNAYTFTPEAAVSTLLRAGILFFILRYFLRRWPIGPAFQLTPLLRAAFLSIVVFLAAMKLIGFCIAFVFDNIERNFNAETFFNAMFTDLLDAFIYGSFFLAYHYFRQGRQQQRLLSLAQQALADSRFNQLKAQLNPHFLFNNLQVLDELIIADQAQASRFLQQFADIYRYVLQATEQKVVPLYQELHFAQQYFELLHHKYGAAYQLHVPDAPLPAAGLVPLTLQILLENAVQHNLGTAQAPVLIRLTIQNNTLQVQNNTQPKQYRKATQGRALHNLQAQYQWLSPGTFSCTQSDQHFTVSVPLLPSSAA